MSPQYKIPPLPLEQDQQVSPLVPVAEEWTPQRGWPGAKNPLTRMPRSPGVWELVEPSKGNNMDYDSKRRLDQQAASQIQQPVPTASGVDQEVARRTAIMQANAAPKSFGEAALSVLPETYKIAKEAGSNLPGPTAVAMNGIDVVDAAWHGDLQGMLIGFGGMIGGAAGKQAAKGFFHWHELASLWEKTFPVAHQKFNKFRTAINEVLSRYDLSHSIEYKLTADGHEMVIENIKVASLDQLDRVVEDFHKLGLNVVDVSKVLVRDPANPNRYVQATEEHYKHLLSQRPATPNPAVSQAKQELPEPHGRFAGSTPKLDRYSESQMPQFKELAKGIFGARRQSVSLGQMDLGPEAKYVRIPDMTITESPNRKWLDELHAWVNTVKALGVETIELPERIIVHYEHGSFYAYSRSNYDKFFY